jgi:hypothetical protein
MITRREAIQMMAGAPAVLSTVSQAGTTAAPPAVLRGARPAGDIPNLLFLWTDEQRADTMAAYGNTRVRVGT